MHVHPATPSPLLIAMCIAYCAATVGLSESKADEPQSPASFVVTTTNYAVGNEQPIDRHRVVFDQSVVYDFDELTPGSITVYDPNRKRIVLLNSQSKSRCVVNTDQLTKMTAEMRVSADTNKKKDQYGISATVNSDADDRLSIQFGNVKYTTSTQPAANQNAASQFAQFADWALRLNMARKQGLPPFGRMSLNRAIATKGHIPSELMLDVKVAQYKSVHAITPKLTNEDRKRIDEASGMIALYSEIPLSDFR
ncbi:hypothetical protein [Planctomycetes bacterium K23_9]|uniref:DUF4412 domain-containing protein n=1 Tax=Stieleria marina TaxID=1930275 RepID=A0A517NSQ0_9BACT|nr:hypothetical protein K239x_20810 [Planctomycetes bacterium K23_9]